MLATGTGNSTPLPTTKQNEKITLFYAVFDPISQFYNHAQSYVRAARVFAIGQNLSLRHSVILLWVLLFIRFYS